MSMWLRYPVLFKVLFLGFYFVPSLAQARLFSFNNETVAPYFNLRGGMSQLGSDPYQWQSVGTYSGDKFDFTYGGEFGLYLRGAGMGLRVGALVQTFDDVSGGLGSDSSGNVLFSVVSQGRLFGPSFAFDIQFAEQPTHLWKLVLGGGYQWAQFENDYSVTAQGQPFVSGQSQFSEKYKAQLYYAMIGVSGEIVLTDTTTVEFLLGYHYSFPAEWKYSGGGENFSGIYQEGDKVQYEDGTDKSLDLSYPFIQIGFNFYIDLVR